MNVEKDIVWRCGESDVKFLSCVCRILKLGKAQDEGRDFQDEGVKDK